MTAAEIIQQQANEIQALKAELTTFQKRCEQYAQAYDLLQHQIKELQRNRFGKKSERFIDPEQPQLSFFANDQKPFVMNSVEMTIEDEIPLSTHSYKKKRKKEKIIPVRVEIIPVNEADKRCVCGACKTVIRYETKQMLHHQQAVFEIIEQRREVVACAKGCDSQIMTAPAPLQALPKVKATEEFLSFLVVSKLDDRQPLYHLEKQLLQRYGMDCSRQTMARWLIDLKAVLQPLYNLYKDHVIDYDMSSCDATGLQVLREPGRSPETKSYLYCMRGGPPDKHVILYAYNDTLHKAFIKDWFTGFSGYLHVDGDHVFEGLGENVQLVNCNAHARRKFEPIANSTKGKGIAKEALRYFKALYKIEREAKKQSLNPEQRYALRQREAKPLLDQFKQWLEGVWPTVLPQSPLGKAIQYCLKLWSGLIRYLDDGRLEIDNNLTEQQIKPFVIARKNFLFCTSVEGAEALCLHFSLIRTAKLHGLDPYHYYVHLLKRLPYCQTVEDYEKLLAWNIKLAEAKAA